MSSLIPAGSSVEGQVSGSHMTEIPSYHIMHVNITEGTFLQRYYCVDPHESCQWFYTIQNMFYSTAHWNVSKCEIVLDSIKEAIEIYRSLIFPSYALFLLQNETDPSQFPFQKSRHIAKTSRELFLTKESQGERNCWVMRRRPPLEMGTECRHREGLLGAFWQTAC